MISQPPSFVPGLELAERLDAGAVRPLLERFAPELPYAAGLIGSGSDVLVLDTVRSMDHDGGPRLFLYLGDGRLQELCDRLDQVLRERLPPAVAGHPTRFRQFVDDEGTRHMDQAMASGPIDHAIAITSVSAFLHRFGVSRTDELSATAKQHLLEVTTGRIFRDDIGEITRVRKDLAWYPDAEWRYRIAAQRMLISQLEPFIGRWGELGDDLGSQIVAMPLARDVIRLAPRRWIESTSAS